MRLVIDIWLRHPNKRMEEALREICARHDFSGGLPYDQSDHETYDICMAVLGETYRPQRFKFWRRW